MRYFAGTSARFCAGLVAVLFLANSALHLRNVHDHGRRLITADAYRVVEAAHRPGPRVTRVVLGDSVARQFFRPGAEPTPGVRYLATNANVSLGGDFYLVQAALERCPNVREVDLVLFYTSWRHDLTGVMSRDYFCGNFHSPRQVAEVFAVRRDVALTAAHVGRMLLPDLMAENSRWHLAASSAAPPAAGQFSPTQPGMEQEPILDGLSHLLGPDHAPRIVPWDVSTVQVSPFSMHYLARLRELCRARGVRLRVLPAPCPADRRLVAADRVYDADAPVVYMPPADFRDGIHFKPEAIERARRKFIAAYGVDRDPLNAHSA